MRRAGLRKHAIVVAVKRYVAMASGHAARNVQMWASNARRAISLVEEHSPEDIQRVWRKESGTWSPKCGS